MCKKKSIVIILRQCTMMFRVSRCSGRTIAQTRLLSQRKGNDGQNKTTYYYIQKKIQYYFMAG